MYNVENVYKLGLCRDCNLRFNLNVLNLNLKYDIIEINFMQNSSILLPIQLGIVSTELKFQNMSVYLQGRTQQQIKSA